MSPIDDELRAALRSRAATVAPSPDPLAGVEQRARTIRRRRAASVVAGSVLAVAAVAVVVPALSPPAAPGAGAGGTRVQGLRNPPAGDAEAASPDRALGGGGTTRSTAAPQPLAATRPNTTTTLPPSVVRRYALDPAAPWPFRGDPAGVAALVRSTAVRLSAVDGTPVPAAAVTALFAGRTAGAGRARILVALVREPGRPVGTVVSTSSSAGGAAAIVRRDPLAAGTVALTASLPAAAGAPTTEVVLTSPVLAVMYEPTGPGGRQQAEGRDGAATWAGPAGPRSTYALLDGDGNLDRPAFRLRTHVGAGVASVG